MSSDELLGYPPAPMPPRFSRLEKRAFLVGLVAAAGIVAWGILRSRRGGPPTPEVQPTDCAGVGDGGGELAGFRYLERVTPGADPKQAMPMVILFHSRGSKPENHSGMFYKSLGFPVRVILPEGPVSLGSNRSWTSKPSRTPDQEKWADELEDVGGAIARFIVEITACRPTLGDPVVTGSSEGGHMAYLIASVRPDLVAGAVAVAGYLPTSLWSASMAPTVGLHGEEDTAVPYPRTETYWTTMEAEGAPIRYQSFAGVGHAVPSSVGRAWKDALRGMLA